MNGSADIGIRAALRDMVREGLIDGWYPYSWHGRKWVLTFPATAESKAWTRTFDDAGVELYISMWRQAAA